jgi:hypothetical protein
VGSVVDEIFLPVIAESDFEAFRALLKGEIAPTYDGWTKSHQERVHYWSTQLGVIEVKAAPDEFRRFCLSEAIPYDGNSLLKFAAAIGKAKK